MTTPPTKIEIRLAQATGKLNARRRRLIQAILASSNETFFLSSHQLARRYRVNPATIVRTIQVLGYNRFADFAEDMREHFVAHLTPYTIMEASVRETGTIRDRVRRALDQDRRHVAALSARPNIDGVVDLARRIHRSRRVIVVGVDLAATLASYLAYGLLPLGVDAEAPTGTSGNLYHKIRTLTRKDLVIGISFGRCLKETVDALKRARERHVFTFGITDAGTTPVARHSDAALTVSIASLAFTGSYVGPMALFNALLVACAHAKPKRSLALLRQSEDEYRTGPRWYGDELDDERLSLRSSGGRSVP
ncbi:MAG TPA: MurR/RpiR family transcriptional regulator [Vicinamibacterales bacterium]|nr:MurR/RpiR family transcriptional regulator [Vicinamibacterales bacterium]